MTESVSTERATKSPAAYLKEPMTANQADFAEFCELAARQAGVWPETEKERAAFLLGVKGAGLYARYQFAKRDGGKGVTAVKAELKKLRTVPSAPKPRAPRVAK